MGILSRLSAWVLALFGWNHEGELPTQKKLIMIVAPHTSNWDFPVAILFKYKLKIRGNYLAKHTVFRGPAGWFMRLTGAIPVIRHEHHNLVDQVTQMFAERDRLWLGIAPAGTRSKTPYWRSGFYHMALAASVPLVPVIVDFGRKRLVLGSAYHLTGDMAVDMNEMRRVFEGARGRRHELGSPIRLRAEDESVANPTAGKPTA